MKAKQIDSGETYNLWEGHSNLGYAQHLCDSLRQDTAS